ncbi:cytochrome P450 10-like isoform X1 [Halichondria panicea]|uniref:cytochrome P450 10-like isoform X1 n=1 Tax=Halichondria panicea TaxID=6063 RepID=UPI00312B530D
MPMMFKLTSKVFTPGCKGVFHIASLSTTVAHDQHQQESPKAKPFSEIPGNSGLPIIGAIELLTKLGNGKVGKESFFHEVRDKYGPIAKFKTPGLDNKWMVFANGPEATEAMFRAEGQYPSRNALLSRMVADLHTINKWPLPMLFADGEDWKRIRSAIGKQVIPRRVGNLTPVLCDITDDLLVYFREVVSNKNGQIEDITPLMTMWAFQNTTYFVFGENMNVYDTSNANNQAFIAAGLDFFNSLQAVILNPLPIYKYYHTKAYKKFIQTTTHA